MADRTIQQHINDNRDELDKPDINAQRRRHIEGELESLEKVSSKPPRH